MPQCFLSELNWTKEKCLLEMPLNTGVFLIRSTERSKSLLNEAYKQRQRLFFNGVWNGIGEQEALISLLQKDNVAQPKIKYLKNLQCMPKAVSDNSLFIHFYGNGATHILSNKHALEVISSWAQAIQLGTALPDNRIQFHWSCIQNKQPNMIPDRGGPERFLYKDSDFC
ncbi:hypothetical protein GNP35_09605 [Psychrosphaera haliotis]|uniref:Nucleotide-diphospho-sugar transferase domain-containing protein n=1 Tax=Psychrosphaera haliotis TaxID=555083 RepID=A0A6N8FEG7_9GAMM|nr:hypothetical protein [Psychrosphaera haliotis]